MAVFIVCRGAVRNYWIQSKFWREYLDKLKVLFFIIWQSFTFCSFTFYFVVTMNLIHGFCRKLGDHDYERERERERVLCGNQKCTQIFVDHLEWSVLKKKVNEWKLWSIFIKCSMLNFWQSSEYVSCYAYCVMNSQG